jgi:DNA-binding protein HU-beta
MTKADIVNNIANKTGQDRSDVQNTVETFLKLVKSNMIEGKNIYFRGFGSFILKKRAKKIARNISKNTSMVLEEHYIPKFKPSKTFVDKVKKSDFLKVGEPATAGTRVSDF